MVEARIPSRLVYTSTTFFLIEHFFKGFLLSGYPLYPSPILGFESIPWAIPFEEVQRDLRYIYLWARSPYSDIAILNNWMWLESWVKNFPVEGVRYFIAIILAFSINILALKGLNKKNSVLYLYIFLIPLLSSILFWFLSAPDWRFLGSVPDLLIGVLIWQAVNNFPERSLSFITANTRILNISILVLIGIIFLKMTGLRSLILYTGQHFPINTYTFDYSKFGIKVYLPSNLNGGNCWNAPLPCAPGLNSNLNTINFNNLLFNGFKSQRD